MAKEGPHTTVASQACTKIPRRVGTRGACYRLLRSGLGIFTLLGSERPPPEAGGGCQRAEKRASRTGLSPLGRSKVQHQVLGWDWL